MKQPNIRLLTSMAALTAMEIVLSRFLSISAWNMKIGLSFVPLAAAAILYGPLPAAVVAGAGDFIGAVLFPFGPYFPGFTLTAVLRGVVLGACLHKKQTLPRIVLAVLINQLVLSLLVNTLWISLLYTTPYLPQLTMRLAQVGVMTAVEIVVIAAMTGVLQRLGKRVTE